MRRGRKKTVSTFVHIFNGSRIMTRLCLLIGIIITIICPVGWGAACTSTIAPHWDHPWPMFHGFENHIGSSTSFGPTKAGTPAKFLASTDSGNPPNSIAIDKNGVIYLAGGNKVYSLSYTNRFILNWSKSYPSAQGPALSHDGNTLYFGYNDDPQNGPGYITALNTSNGSLKWKYQVGGALHFGPTIGPDGTIYQGAWDKYFYAINSNGSLKWRYLTAGNVSYPPSILNCAQASVGQLIILGGGDAHNNGFDGNIYAFDTSGNLKWKYDTGKLRVGSPAITSDGLIYAPAAPTLYVFDSNGTLQWTLGDTQTSYTGIITPAVSSSGLLYTSTSAGKVFGIDSLSRSVSWTFTVPDVAADMGIPTFPVVDKVGTVYFGNRNHYMYAVDSSGNLVFKYLTGDGMAEAAPTLVNGILFISSDDGNLYRIDGR